MRYPYKEIVHHSVKENNILNWYTTIWTICVTSSDYWGDWLDNWGGEARMGLHV